MGCIQSLSPTHLDMKDNEEFMRQAGLDIYESLVELAPEGFRGQPLYLSDGVWVYPDGTMESE